MKLPAGYTALRAGARRAIVRDDLVSRLGSWLIRVPLAPPANAVPIAGGRGGAFRLPLGEDRAVVVRLGRRGGALGRIVHSRYLGLRPRPWRELAVSLAARQAGAPVPVVAAACVHGWGLYRSAVVTEEIPGVITAIEALRRARDVAARATVAAAAGAAVARLHAAGVIHPDLNLANILVGAGGATIVDLDRARLRHRPLGRHSRRRALARLARSARKLDPASMVVDAETARRFHEAYAGAEARCDS
jgi:3-deoxy-D-manno-octulosonic acid kinase